MEVETCSDTLAKCHLPSTFIGAGTAATTVDNTKKLKYASLNTHYELIDFVVETMGLWSPNAKLFVINICKHFYYMFDNREPKSYFIRRRTIEIQRGNAKNIIGIMDTKSDTMEININIKYI